jgi:hypothetical protein
MSKLVGTKPYQTPRNADLGTLAYQDKDNVNLGQLLVNNSVVTNQRIAPVDIKVNSDHNWSSTYNLSNSGNHGSIALYLNNDDTSNSNAEVRLLFSAGGAGSGQHEIAVQRTGSNLGDMIFRRRTSSSGTGTQSTETLRITNAGRIIMGTYTSTSDQSDYGISVYRKGTSSSPATFSFSDAAYDYAALYGQGPSSYIQSGDLLNASYGRIVLGDSNTHNFAIIDISYDSGLSPMRLDGRGNLWLGHNRAAATTDSTRSYSLKAAGKVYATQGFNNGGVREYAQAISGVRNDTAYTWDVPIQATGAGYTVYYECMYNHYGNTTYGAWRSGFFSFRSLNNDTYYDDVIKDQNSSNAGAWSVTMIDEGTSSPKMRFTKSAGTYPGSGAGHIFVRGGLVE